MNLVELIWVDSPERNAGPDNFDRYFKDSYWPGNTLFISRNFPVTR